MYYSGLKHVAYTMTKTTTKSIQQCHLTYKITFTEQQKKQNIFFNGRIQC